MPWRIINSKLATFKPFFACFWLEQELNDSLSDDALRACDRIEMLLPRYRDAAEAVPLQIKLMVNAFVAMLSHHARADLPLGNKLDALLFQIVKFREDS